MALKFPEVQAKLKTLGFTANWTTPAQLQDRMARELAAWGGMITAIGLEAQ